VRNKSDVKKKSNNRHEIEKTTNPGNSVLLRQKGAGLVIIIIII